jgi:hypothetical protein
MEKTVLNITTILLCLEFFIKEKVDSDRQGIFTTNCLRRIRRPKPEGFYVQVFLGVIAKLQKAIISFVMSVCLSARREQLASYWADFHEI